MVLVCGSAAGTGLGANKVEICGSIVAELGLEVGTPTSLCAC